MKGKAGKFIILNINEENDVIKSEITMEVHHHPQVEKKESKNTFLEFLMIFLAVTLGFFAENISEKITNKAIENEYMQSIVSDLKADTSAISQAIDIWSSANNDVAIIQQSLKARPVDVKNFYKSLSEDFWHFDLFKYDNKTVEELKSSGNFRLIRDKKIGNQWFRRGFLTGTHPRLQYLVYTSKQ